MSAASTRPIVRRSRLPPAAALALAAILAPAAAGEWPAAPRVTFVSFSSVYVSAGDAEGLSAGDRLEVLRDGVVVALLEVRLTSNHKADCRPVDGSGEIRAGDGVRRLDAVSPAASAAAPPSAMPAATATVPPESIDATPGLDVPPAPQPPEPASPAPASAAPMGLREFGLRGRVGVRFMGVWARDDGPGYRQPALDLRLDGTRIGGSDFDLNADIRARRSHRTFVGGDSESETRTRVYRLSGSWQEAGTPFPLTFGRQFSPSLSVVSLFDGVMGEFRRERFAAGLFAGTQPDATDFGYSADVREYGGFAEYGSPVAARRRWAVTGGAVASYALGTINREFAFLQGRYDDRRLSAYLTQEVDLNRGWRQEREGERWTATSGYASLRLRVNDRLGLNAGYDSRRSIRLYRDFVSPETDFDDRYRRGYWLGADGRSGDHIHYGVSLRRSDAGGDDTADAVTVLLGARGLGAAAMELSTRGTRYTNGQIEGWLVSLAASLGLTARSRLEAYGGARRETVLGSWIPEESHAWYGLGWDLFTGRRWMFTTTMERNQGQAEDNDQVYATMSYRF